MAKTIETLTQNELEIIQEFMDAFGISDVEALAAAIAEGAISESGQSMRFAPDDFKELKFYIVNNKSHYYKINKQLKKEKKDEMFAEDHFFYDTQISKLDDGYDLEKCSTVDLGESPKIIVLANYFKAKRATFDAAGKADSTNFETSLASTLSNSDQERMLILSGDDKGKSAKQIRDALKKQYKEDIPDKVKVKFRVVTYGLVEVGGEWKRFYIETASRFKDEDKTTYHFDKELSKTLVKAKYLCSLAKTGEDDNDNPIIQIMVEGELEKDKFLALRDEINKARTDMLDFVSGQFEVATSSISSKESSKATTSKDKEESDEKDPFEDEE